ncbi:MAG TPA: hypothetical protein VFO86_08240, partial [Terriglobia bacterium]|nr:hypothetical protein [Terriglobia bacterium]
MSSSPDNLSAERTGEFSHGNKPEVIRRLPVGAEPQPSGGAHFRVWAPRRKTVEVMLGRSDAGAGVVPYELDREGSGYFSGIILDAAPDMLYRYRLDRKNSYPDPASRFQPDGPHGPSQIIDPGAFGWTDGNWRGIQLAGQIVYEMHIGTFTREGTWNAATLELEKLAQLGVTALEIM